jgi:hypothetical protein
VVPPRAVQDLRIAPSKVPERAEDVCQAETDVLRGIVRISIDVRSERRPS